MDKERYRHVIAGTMRLQDNQTTEVTGMSRNRIARTKGSGNSCKNGNEIMPRCCYSRTASKLLHGSREETDEQNANERKQRTHQAQAYTRDCVLYASAPNSNLTSRYNVFNVQCFRLFLLYGSIRPSQHKALFLIKFSQKNEDDAFPSPAFLARKNFLSAYHLSNNIIFLLL